MKIKTSPAPQGLVDDSQPRSELLQYLDRLIYMGGEIHKTTPAILLDRVKQAIHYRPIFSDEQLMFIEAKGQAMDYLAKPEELAKFLCDWRKIYPASTLPGKYQDEA